MITKQELIKEMKCISDRMGKLESRLPYEYAQADADHAFLAQVRQYIYSNRISFGAIRETVKDPRNWSDGCAGEDCQ
jgi:hypothetical protein